jgi:hypothetical protein
MMHVQILSTFKVDDDDDDDDPYAFENQLNCCEVRNVDNNNT